MNYLSIENLSKAFGDHVLFSGLSFGIDKGDKTALIAQNGFGKTTLFNILAKKDTFYEGRIIYNNEVKLGYVNQDPAFQNKAHVEEVIFDESIPELQAIKKYELAIINNNAQQIEEATTEIETLSAWEYEARIKIILDKLGISDLTMRVEELSGGQLKRLAIARVLVRKPNFILLDEPTNHLDIEMIEWLQDYLSKQNITIFMVTHDRYFLEEVCNNIIELDDQQLYFYKGNYSSYLEKRAERKGNESATVMKARNLLRTELEWMRRMPLARGTKSKDRIDRFYQLKEQASKNLSTAELNLEVEPQRLGGKILELDHISKSFGDKNVINTFSYKFQKRERLGLVGNNGSGKTTFLNLITGRLKPDSGSIDPGETVKFGYYSQEGIKLDEGKRVIEAVTDIAEFIPAAKGNFISASQLLERFLFPKSMHYNLVSKLSGGEKRRLNLLRVLMGNPNFLILDEPTNDLDILTLNVLEDFLVSYGACLIIVSHDRYFLDKLVDHLFVFDGQGNIKDINGNYRSYRAQLKREDKHREPEQKKVAVSGTKKVKRGLSYNEKREFESLEKEIEELTAKRKELEKKLEAPDFGHEELIGISQSLNEIIDKLDESELRWLELAEKDGNIS